MVRTVAAVALLGILARGAPAQIPVTSPPSLTDVRSYQVVKVAEGVYAFIGRANTAGDAVVYVPDARVLATGDLVVHPYPYIFGSFVGEWIETMQKLRAIDATSIVPGHGAVEYDKSYLALVQELLEALQTQAKAMVASGVSAEDARTRFELDRFRSRMCPDASPFCETGFRQSMAAAGVRAYREAKEGKLKTEQ